MRKEAPGSLTAAAVAAYWRRRGYPRDTRTVGDFERAQYKDPPDRMFELYAEAVGRTVADVRKAYAKTRRLRERGLGPFCGLKVA